MDRERDGGSILRGGPLGLLRAATTNTERECRHRHGIHIVGWLTWTGTSIVQLCRCLWDVLYIMEKGHSAGNDVSLQPGGSLGCDSQGESQDNCSAIPYVLLSLIPAFQRALWTLRWGGHFPFLCGLFLGTQPHSLIGSGIWPEPAGLSVTVPAPLYVE